MTIASLEDLISPDNPIRFIDAFVAQSSGTIKANVLIRAFMPKSEGKHYKILLKISPKKRGL